MSGPYVYIKSEPGLWTVGHYRPDSRFEAESDHNTENAAADRVHYLNGGLSDEQFRKLFVKNLATLIVSMKDHMHFTLTLDPPKT